MTGFGRSSTTNRFAGEPRRLHAVVQRPDIGVEAGSRVLDVEDDGVHTGGGEDVGECLTALQIRVVDRESGRRVVVAALGPARLRGAPEAVLGAEDGDQVHAVVGVHHVDDVPDVAGDARGVGDHADALAAELGVPGPGEALEAGAEPVAGVLGGLGGQGCQGRRGGTGHQQ